MKATSELLADLAVADARARLEAEGYVVLKARTYRNEQERRRIAERNPEYERKHRPSTLAWAARGYTKARPPSCRRAAGATVALISAYAGWVFESRRQGFIALVACTLLYSLIYVLMRLEDFALLIGAVTSFAASAAAIYFTRRVDWYGANALPADTPTEKA